MDIHEVHASLRGVPDGREFVEHGHDDLPVVGRKEGLVPAGKQMSEGEQSLPPRPQSFSL